MPPKFMASSFKFAEGETVPDHIEEYPFTKEKDTSKLWLEGEDTFSREYYPLAIDIDDYPTARILQNARLRHLEDTQPTSSSGGQSADGIQDGAHIRIP